MVPVRWIPAVVGCCALRQGNRPNGINPHYTGLYRNNWWQAAGSFLQPEGQQQKAPWILQFEGKACPSTAPVWNH